MTSVQIAEQVHPTRQSSQAQGEDDHKTRATSTYIYQHGPTRASSLATEDAFENIRSLPQLLQSGRTPAGHEGTDSDDEDPALRRSSDYRQKQSFHGLQLALLAYSSIGVIYGDIGTSPLYVYSSTFSSPPSHIDLLGVLSLIIWTLTIVVTIKYVIVILNIDNYGEGGTFSTYALLSRYLNITNRDPREASLVEMKRHDTDQLHKAARKVRTGIEARPFIKVGLQLMGLLAVSMVISDGVLTPAQSVLGAVQGIEVVQPGITKGVVIGVTDAILVVLFIIQPLGVSKISMAFSPIIILWLTLLLSFGIYNSVMFDAGVWKAWNPYYAFDFLIRNKEQGWRQLGGVLLCFTGVEALFADLGAFSKRAIQLSWLMYTYPCLLLAYIGQAAYISENPSAYSNPFFNSIPGGRGVLYFSLVVAILAAVVASQAIITATFQLLAQVMKLSYFPQLKVVHTSKTHHGQLYIPIVNWLLMIGTILVASIYNNTTALGQAYGLCVLFVTAFDSIMAAAAAIFVYRINPYLILAALVVIACVDWTYLTSALTKFPHGAWFTVTLAVIIAGVFVLWRFGKEAQWSAEAEDRMPTRHFVHVEADGRLRLAGGVPTDISIFKGLAVFFDKAGEMTPPVFANFVQKLTALPSACVFLHLRPLEIPSVDDGDRFSVSKLGFPNAYRVVVRYGYNDRIVSPDLAGIVFDQVSRFILSRLVVTEAERARNTDPDAEKANTAAHREVDRPGTGSGRLGQQELDVLNDAYHHKVLYVVGKEQMRLRSSTRIIRKVFLATFLWLRDNTRGKIASLKIPAGDLVEVGFIKEV